MYDFLKYICVKKSETFRVGVCLLLSGLILCNVQNTCMGKMKSCQKNVLIINFLDIFIFSLKLYHHKYDNAQCLGSCGITY